MEAAGIMLLHAINGSSYSIRTKNIRPSVSSPTQEQVKMPVSHKSDSRLYRTSRLQILSVHAQELGWAVGLMILAAIYGEAIHLHIEAFLVSNSTLVKTWKLQCP